MKIPTNRFLWLKKNPFEKSFPFFENKKKKNVEIFFFFWNAAKLFIGEFLLPFVNVSSVNENVKDSFLRFLTHFLFPQSFSLFIFLPLSLFVCPSSSAPSPLLVFLPFVHYVCNKLEISSPTRFKAHFWTLSLVFIILPRTCRVSTSKLLMTRVRRFQLFKQDLPQILIAVQIQKWGNFESSSKLATAFWTSRWRVFRLRGTMSNNALPPFSQAPFNKSRSRDKVLIDNCHWSR